MFMDPRVAALAQEERVVPKLRLPGHNLLSVRIALDMACQQVTKIRKIEDPQTAASQPREQHDLVNMCWGTLHRSWPLVHV